MISSNTANANVQDKVKYPAEGDDATVLVSLVLTPTVLTYS